MSFYKINISPSSNRGSISVEHEGLDDQWCESGKVVTIENIPSTGWGLASLFYTKEDGSGKTDIQGNTFVMPAHNVVIFSDFKRFSSTDWTPEIGGGAKVIKVTRSKDIEGYQVPFPTTDEIADIVSSMMEGKVVIIEDKNGRERYLVNFADDYPGGDKVFVIDCYGIMSLTYYIDGTIEVVKLGGTPTVVDLWDACIEQSNIHTLNDLLDYADVSEELFTKMNDNPYGYIVYVPGYKHTISRISLSSNTFLLICNGFFGNDEGSSLFLFIEDITRPESQCDIQFVDR